METVETQNFASKKYTIDSSETQNFASHNHPNNQIRDARFCVSTNRNDNHGRFIQKQIPHTNRPRHLARLQRRFVFFHDLHQKSGILFR